jgi:hypothetical protein
MKRSDFSVEQIVEILQGQGTVRHKHGIGSAMLYL